MSWRVIAGDCIEAMRELPDGSVDAVVTDPPYGLGAEQDMAAVLTAWLAGEEYEARGGGFMGRTWDSFVPGPEIWRQCLRVLKPGGHLLAFFGTRTVDVGALAVRLAGFEIRDTIAWMYGSGFPKSLDVSKAIDKLNGKPLDRLREFGTWMRANREAAGLTAAEVNRRMGMPQGCGWWEGKGAGDKWDLHLPSVETFARLKALYGAGDEWDEFIAWAEAEREVVGRGENWGASTAAEGKTGYGDYAGGWDVTAPATLAAERWEGWGTALKPAHEPIVVARKPLSGTVAQTVLGHGTGALNIDGCRIGTDGGGTTCTNRGPDGRCLGHANAGRSTSGETFHGPDTDGGRWPANVVLDEVAAGMLDEQTGTLTSGREAAGGHRRDGDAQRTVYGSYEGQEAAGALYGDSGGASRFFYVAKASSAERNAGLDGFEARDHGVGHRATDAGTYVEFVHPAPDGIGEWPRERREEAGLSLKAVAAYFPSRTGGITGCVTNWEHEFNRPTPDQWRTLRGLLGFDDRHDVVMTEQREVPRELFDDRERPKARNIHPTVKPVELMRWLIRLVTPPGGTVLDPFLGSGTTGCAAVLERVEFIGIERDAEYVPIAEARIRWWAEHPEGVDFADRVTAEKERAAVKDTGQVDIFDVLGGADAA